MTTIKRVTARDGVHTWEVRAHLSEQLIAFYVEASDSNVHHVAQEKVEEIKRLAPAERSKYYVQ